MTETADTPPDIASALPVAESPVPAPQPATAASEPPENRFFLWVRGLGVVRHPGWIGGVSTGLAARVGIDPLIVRGIFVVTALIGFPSLLIYAIAWSLLPDSEGRILVQDARRRRFEPALIGIGLMVLVSFFPFPSWAWGAIFGPREGGAPATGWGLLTAILTISLIAAAIWLIVWIVRYDHKTPRGGPGSRPWRASAVPTPPGPLPEPDAAGAEPGAAGAVPVATLIPPPVPPGPAPDPAATEEYAAWRAQQDAWRVQQDAWRRRQKDAEAAARAVWREERSAAQAVFAAEAADRRRMRRATKPRTSFLFVAVSVGVVLIGGAIGALLALVDVDTAGFAGAVGLLTGALVLALSMMVAGIARRRSGFLSFMTLVTLLVGIVSAGVSGGRPLIFGDLNLGMSSEDTSLTQIIGHTRISVSSLVDEGWTAGDVSLRKTAGDTDIEVFPGASLQLNGTVTDGRVTIMHRDPATEQIVSVKTMSPQEGTTPLRALTINNPDADGNVQSPYRVELTQHSGDLLITIYDQESSANNE